jgi:hypothetical protein
METEVRARQKLDVTPDLAARKRQIGHSSKA